MLLCWTTIRGQATHLFPNKNMRWRGSHSSSSNTVSPPQGGREGGEVVSSQGDGRQGGGRCLGRAQTGAHTMAQHAALPTQSSSEQKA